MSGTEVPRVRTPISPEDLVDVLARGHHAALGEPPGEPRLRMAWAQVMLENGRGRDIICFNIGNITAGPAWPGPFYVEHVRERVQRDPDVWRDLDLRFRARRDHVDGAADYWRRIAGEYASALPLFDSGDVDGAVTELSRLRYFTALVAPYERGVNLIAREFAGALWRYP